MTDDEDADAAAAGAAPEPAVSSPALLDPPHEAATATEATMTALRLARAFTKRNKIIKFEGCYHGLHDAALVSVKPHPPADDFGDIKNPKAVSGGKGVPQASLANVPIATFNDLETVERRFRENPNQIAAVILEPIMMNVGLCMPEKGFLEGLREVSNHGLRALLDVVSELIEGEDFHGCIFVNAAMEFPLPHEPAHQSAVRNKQAIQEMAEHYEWVGEAGSPAAYAPHLRKAPLASVTPKSVLFLIARGDQTAPNPATTAIVRAGDEGGSPSVMSAAGIRSP